MRIHPLLSDLIGSAFGPLEWALVRPFNLRFDCHNQDRRKNRLKSGRGLGLDS